MVKVIKIYNLDHKSILYNLKQFEFIFYQKKRDIESFHIDLAEINNVNTLGLLLLYKILEYNAVKNLYDKTEVKDLDYKFYKKLVEYSFGGIIKEYLKGMEETEKLFENLKPKIENNFLIAPHPLLRDFKFTFEYFEKKYLPKIKQFYTEKSKQQMLLEVFVEITSNFWEHAIEDSKTILVANGSLDNVEICCIDTAIGILSSLKPTFSKVSNKNLLSKSVEFQVTSKENTNHMGHGLWIVNEIIKESKSIMHIYSEGYYYKNDKGIITSGKCGFWKGTIIFINLNLANAKTKKDLNYPKSKRANELLINFN